MIGIEVSVEDRSLPREIILCCLWESVRGTLAFVDMSKGHAFMSGRDYVLPGCKKGCKSGSCPPPSF